MMTLDRRTLTAAASVAAIALAVLIALQQGPRGYRAYLTVAGLIAVGMAVSSVVAEPRELLVALVFGAAPVMSLTTEGSPSWLIAPLAVLLLVGGELNALSWEFGGTHAGDVALRARAMSIARLAAVALLASLAVAGTARFSFLSGTVATVTAAVGLIALGLVVLPRPAPDDVRGDSSLAGLDGDGGAESSETTGFA